MENPNKNTRLNSIDTLRGLIIIIKALDHVRDFFGYTPYRVTDVTQASVLLFLTRWITHLCAPTFILLSGVSMFLYSRKVASLGKTSMFLLTRGLWLIAVEVLLISFILTQSYDMTLLAIFWAIGCSMILLAALIWLPRWAQAGLALAMILGHDALPAIGVVTKSNMLPAFLHNTPFFVAKPPILVAYAIVPWVGVMLLGYAIGEWFTFEPIKRNRLLLGSGVLALLIFVVLRTFNGYGDPSPWSVQARGSVYTFLSFLNVSKSPPSLLFLSVTLGIACMLPVFLDKFSTGFQKIFGTYGRVPFFFFVLHLAIISLTSWLWTYYAFGKGVNLSFTSPQEWPAGYHPNLLRVYIVWALLVLSLYFPCRWFGQFKSARKSRWVSYL